MRVGEALFGGAIVAASTLGGLAIGHDLGKPDYSDSTTVDIEALQSVSAQIVVNMLASLEAGSCEQPALHELIMEDPNVDYPHSAADMAAKLDLVCKGGEVNHTDTAAVAFPFFAKDKELRTDMGTGLLHNKNLQVNKNDTIVEAAGGVIGLIVGALVLASVKARHIS